MTNLVMGFSTYEWDKCGVFVRSLRESGYKDDLILIGHGLDDAYTSQHSVTVKPMEKPTDLVVSRFDYYRHVLEKGDWDKVFLTDVRDVVFQSDPFDLIGSGLHVTEEDLLIGEQRHNRDRTIETFGQEIFESLKDKRIICAGTIYGGRIPILEFIRKFNEIASTQEGNGFHISDQPILMYLTHNGLMDNLSVDANDGRHAVWTIGTRDETHHDDFYQLDGHLIRMLDGHLPSAVHQYDRHPRIVKALEDYYLL